MADPRVELDRLCARLGSAQAPLDDLARARAEARLEAALADPAAHADPAPADAADDDGDDAPVRTRPRLWRAGAALLALAAAAALALALLRRGDVPLVVAVPEAELEPYVVAPHGAPVTAEITPPVLPAGAHLDVPAGWLVRATVGAHATVTAIGPAALDVAGTRDAPVIHLGRGRLLAALEPATDGGRRELRVLAPGSEVIVVGTLFAVDAEAGSSRVSVRHGRVRVRAGGGEIELGAGRTWHAAAPVVEPELVELLDEHERILPPAGPAVAVVLAGAPSAAEVWLDGARVATTPAWLRLPGGTTVRLTAPGFAATTVTVPAQGPGATRAPLVYRLDTTPAPTPAPPAPRARPLPLPAPAAAPPAAVPMPVPAPAAGTPAPPTAGSLYAAADRALAAGDHDGARAALLELLRRYPDDPLADAAGFDLASMALSAGELDAAGRYLAGVDDAALAEPRAYLACRIELARRSARAGACLAAFRARYPASAHDADALAQEAALRFDQDGCAAARPLLADYLRRYPRGAAAAGLRTRLERCDAPR